MFAALRGKSCSAFVALVTISKTTSDRIRCRVVEAATHLRVTGVSLSDSQQKTRLEEQPSAADAKEWLLYYDQRPVGNALLHAVFDAEQRADIIKMVGIGYVAMDWGLAWRERGE